MTPAKLAFVDTETTGLNPDLHEVWEIAIITADPYEDRSGYKFEEWTTQLNVNLGHADPMALTIGGWYERAEQWIGKPPREDDAPSPLFHEAEVAREIVQRTKGRHFIGAVPSFDAIRLEKIVKRNSMVPTWHYHLVDVEHLAAGFLAAKAAFDDTLEVADASDMLDLARPPWKSDDLAAAVEVTIAPEDRHTALGDARWARDIYFAVMGGEYEG